MELELAQRYKLVVDEIAGLSWSNLTRDDLMSVAWGYYYFSVQFRESLDVACSLNPWDERLKSLREGECDTDNLSPFPGVADRGERMNHDEFMRRVLVLTDRDAVRTARAEAIGNSYLAETRGLSAMARALSIPSYEDGGLETVFRSILSAPDWDHPALLAFQHFLVCHIQFDSDDEGGHGMLSRHLVPDDRILPLWVGFRDLLVDVAPALLQKDKRFG